MITSAGRPARAVQWAWLPILAAALAVYAFSLPYRYRALSTFAAVTLPTGWTTPTWQAALAEHGVDGRLYALLRLAGDALFVLVFFSVATLLWLRARDRLTHYVAVFLLVFGLDWVQDLDVMPVGWYWPLRLLSFAAVVLMMFFFFLFPDGRFQPRWSRWVAGGLLVFGLASLVRPEPGPAANLALYMGILTLLTVAQVYRYRRVSTGVQRQQTKWVVLGFSTALIALLALVLLGAAYPVLQQPGQPGLLYELAGQVISGGLFLLIPISIAIAIQRYRLWEIDALINRALVYGALSAGLAAIYFLSVAVLQNVFFAVTGQTRSALVTVLATLLIAALFSPLRRAVQTIIDRRFYRQHYNAALTLATFGATLRDHVELEALRDRLLTVVDNTMQPEAVALWLKKPE